MSFSNKGALVLDKKLNDTGKVTTLNPNAAEFIPSALRSPSGSTRTENASSRFMTAGTGTQGKAVLDRSESSVSNNSDEEAHHYWRRQLPDDITPDFLVMGEDEFQGANVLPFSSLSLHEGNKTSRFSPTSAGGGFLLDEQQDLSTNRLNGNSFIETMGSSSSFLRLPTKPWDKKVVNNDQLLTSVVDGHPYAGNSTQTYVNNILNEQSFSESMGMNPLEFLASQFPGFAAESLAELHFANGGDLNLTIEMLTQLELQVDGGLNQNFDSKALSAPNFGALDFPALSTPDGQNGLPKFSRDDLQQSLNPYQSSDKDNMLSFKSNSSISSRGAIDFAAAVKKTASQDSAMWKYDRNGSANASVGSSRSSHVLASSYSGGQGRGIYGDKLQTRGSARAAPVWLETGDSVANMYSEMREEARDYARLRNAYFEQARQAYLVGNKALAKELSVKGQLHNMQMKAAHEKAQESIYRQRNPSSSDMKGGNMRGQEKIIDLHGLHVSEAIHVLKRELTVLRSAARSAHQRLQVYICVGTGHHTRGSRTPARLPIAVQQYLLDEEGLDYSEPQPGLLRVVIY